MSSCVIKGARWEAIVGKVLTREDSLWYQLQGQGIPKTTLRLDNLVAGLKELIESCYTHSSGEQWEDAD